jgi:hypothetical protein
MTQNINTQAHKNMTQTHTGNRIYRLAKDGAYQVQPFGPLLTLAQAQAYQVDMALGGFDVLVINTGAM